jgi:hypothetical protein
MKAKTVLVFSLCVSALFIDCAAKIKRNFLNEPYRAKTISVALSIAGIEVVDGRSSLDTETLWIPSFTFKKVGDTVIPPLTSAQEAVIKDEIAHYAKGSGPEVKVKATIKEGTKQYSMGFFNSRECAKAAMTVELLDSVHTPYLFSTTGEAYYEVKSTKADTLFLEKLYRKALKTCVYKAFESIQEFLEKQPPSAGKTGGL